MIRVFLLSRAALPAKFEDLSSEVLKDGCEVDGSTGTDTLSVVAFSQETMDTADWECEACLGGSAVTDVSTCSLL